MALTYAFQIVLFTGMLFYLDWQLALAAFVASQIPLIARCYRGASRRRPGSCAAGRDPSAPSPRRA